MHTLCYRTTLDAQKVNIKSNIKILEQKSEKWKERYNNRKTKCAGCSITMYVQYSAIKQKVSSQKDINIDLKMNVKKKTHIHTQINTTK